MIDILAFVFLTGSAVALISSLFEGSPPSEKTDLDHYLLPILKPNTSHLSDAGRSELIKYIKTLEQSDDAGKK